MTLYNSKVFTGTNLCDAYSKSISRTISGPRKNTLNIQPVRKLNQQNIISSRIPEVIEISLEDKFTGIIKINFNSQPLKIEFSDFHFKPTSRKKIIR